MIEEHAGGPVEVLEGGGSIENLDKTARVFLEHFRSLTQ